MLVHPNPEELVDQIIRNPLVMIASASDGAAGHPRNTGTFSRILARHVRQLGSLTLVDALPVKDNATYQAPMAPSTGMQFVIVNGTVLIDRGKLVDNTFPGKAL